MIETAGEKWLRENFGIPLNISAAAGLELLRRKETLPNLDVGQGKNLFVIQRHVKKERFSELPCVPIYAVDKTAAWYWERGLNEQVQPSDDYLKCRWEVFCLVNNYANNDSVKKFKVGMTTAQKEDAFKGMKRRFNQADYREYEICIGIVVGHRSMVASLEDWLHTHASAHPKYAAFRGAGGSSNEPFAFLYIALSLSNGIPREICSTIKICFPGSSMIHLLRLW